MIFAIIWQFSGWNSFQCGVARLECMCSMINVCVSVSVRVLLSALQMVMNDDLLKETLALTSLTDGSCGYLSPSSRPWRACSVCLSTCPDCSSCWPLGTSGRWRRCSTLGYRCGTSGRSGRTRTRRPCRSGRLFLHFFWMVRVCTQDCSPFFSDSVRERVLDLASHSVHGPLV